MKTRFTPLLTALAVFALVVFGAAQALAYTAAGTTVSSQATLEYWVNGIEQDPIASDDGEGNGPTTFVVDRLVRPLVELQTATQPVAVTPGSTSQVLTFTVTNDGNDPVGLTSKFTLNVIADGANTVTPSAITYEVDGVPYTLGNAVEIASEDSITVTVFADFATSAVNAQSAIYHLEATAVADDGSSPLTTTGPTDVEDVILADAAGSAAGDDAGDGKHSASGAYEVESAALTVTKTQAIVADGLGGTDYYIPGAIVRYTITIENTGSVAASSVMVNDQIPANTAYVTDSLEAIDSDNNTYNSGPPAAIQVGYDTIGAGETRTITFEVEIQ